ncbi:acyl-CoA dehydratase activase [Peptoniphilus asaccharolyticus]
MYTMGVDIGSTSSKIIILKDGANIFANIVVQAGTGTSGPALATAKAKSFLSNYNMTLDDISKTVVTGYGRFSFELADKQISEITCHTKGINFLVPEARTILDIGGQDTKSISLSDNGQVLQFFMNDKCAAGTGRFLEVMAKILEIPLEKMGEYDKLATNAVNISSTCTVFAESEVISQLSKGISKENILAGVHNSTAHKACGLLYRTGIKEKIVLCGGVAQNKGVVRALKEELNKEIIIAPHPQMTGAIGAALFAYEEANKNL